MRTHRMSTKLLLAFLNLARVRIGVMVLVACAIGFILSYQGEFPLYRFLWTLLGTGLLSSGSCALNCYLEREADALMPRTSGRPIPAGVISPAVALAYGVGLILTGALLLWCHANLLSAGLGLAAVFIYLVLYTPAKRVTWLNTSIGALPGAIPPLIGWASATGQLEAGGWILFAMLVLWQHTHFFPIAWLYKSDYEKGGFRMLPVLEPKGEKTFALTVVTAIALLPVSLLLCSTDTGLAYKFGATLSGAMLIAGGIRLARHPSNAAARNVLLLSLLYLPVILAAVIIDRYGMQFGTNLHAWLEVMNRWT